MAKIIDGKRIAAETRARIRKDTEHFIARTGITPGLAVIIVGDNPASQVYVRNKKRACEEAGMNSWVFEMPESTSMSELLSQIELLKNDETLVIVDPAMADNGKYYANLGDKMTECFRRLIKKADIITPNITEACFLTGMEYRPGTHSMAYVTELIDRLSELGPNFVAVTGVSAEPGKVGIVARDNKSGRLCSVMNEALDGTFHGAGDVFASAFAALLTRGAALEDALNAAEKFVTAAIERTAKRNTPRHYGLDFEGVLPKYIEICRGLFE